MIPFERKEKIISILQKNNLMLLNDIQKSIPDVSISTIRRDVKELEKEGIVTLLHGGAVKLYSKSVDTPIDKRGTLNKEAKQKLSDIAVELVNDGDTVYIDSGSTNEEILLKLIHKSVTIVTSSSLLVSLPEPMNATIYSLGGQLNTGNNSLIGEITNKSLLLFNFDVAFIGINGVDINFGYTTPSIPEAEKKKIVLTRSVKSYFVCDSSKFHKVYMASVTGLKDTNLITDKEDAGIKEKVSKYVTKIEK